MKKLEHTVKNYEDALMGEPLFLDELFMKKYDHIGERTCVEDFKFIVLFEKRNLDLSIFTFDEPNSGQSSKNKIEEHLID